MRWMKGVWMRAAGFKVHGCKVHGCKVHEVWGAGHRDCRAV